MKKQIENILDILRKRCWTLGVMESCTGGAISNEITNIPNASDVFKEGQVTYSDEAKIKAGVDRKIIKNFGVYSIETAEEMARKISGDIAVGVTGNMNDPAEVFVAVRIEKKIWSEKFLVGSKNKNEIEARKEKKIKVVEKVMEMIIDNL